MNLQNSTFRKNATFEKVSHIFLLFFQAHFSTENIDLSTLAKYTKVPKVTPCTNIDQHTHIIARLIAQTKLIQTSKWTWEFPSLIPK